MTSRPRSHAAPRLGIFGGGQLARMLAEAAMRQGLEVVVLTQTEDSPAALDGVRLVLGPLDDKAAIEELIARSDYVTLENEFLDLEAIRAALARHPEVRFRPPLAGIAVAQDKLEQKRLFRRLGIATAAFEVMQVDAFEAELERLGESFPEGYVLKWSRYGYDGRGNFVVASPRAVAAQDAQEFVRAGERAGAQIYAERLIDFQSELAMVSTRAPRGEHAFFPLVVSRQESGVCREVYGPATAFGVDARLEHEAEQVLQTLGSELDMCGTFAVEFFLCRDGQLLANEMAPRVHNTGHFTLFADEPSQFDLHVQAVTDRPLTVPAVHALAAMRNLLGPFSMASDRPCPAPSEPPPPGTSLYWYHKASASPGRKMGHLTGRADSVEEISTVLRAMREYEHRFWTTQADERR
jgi:5-(carboxyamino)imidazole ribonucleotide synthase